MSDYFHCKLCDKSIKLKSKEKHLISQYHHALTKSIISSYYITNPNFLRKEDILKKYVYDNNEKVRFHLFICKCTIIFSYLAYNFKFNRMYDLPHCYNLRKCFITKIDRFMRYGHELSFISELNFTFITDFDNKTYEFCLKQPKSMLECRLIENLARNPKLINAFDRTLSHPLIREYCDVDPVEYPFSL